MFHRPMQAAITFLIGVRWRSKHQVQNNLRAQGHEILVQSCAVRNFLILQDLHVEFFTEDRKQECFLGLARSQIIANQSNHRAFRRIISTRNRVKRRTSSTITKFAFV